MAFFTLLLKDQLVADLFKTILNTVIITTPCIALLDKWFVPFVRIMAIRLIKYSITKYQFPVMMKYLISKYTFSKVNKNNV